MSETRQTDPALRSRPLASGLTTCSALACSPTLNRHSSDTRVTAGFCLRARTRQSWARSCRSARHHSEHGADISSLSARPRQTRPSPLGPPDELGTWGGRLSEPHPPGCPHWAAGAHSLLSRPGLCPSRVQATRGEGFHRARGWPLTSDSVGIASRNICATTAHKNVFFWQPLS